MITPHYRRQLIIVLALLAGALALLALPEQPTQAGGGFPPQVLALKADAAPAFVVSHPDGGGAVLAELHAGDRVLRISGAIAPRADGTYIPVYTASGAAGWLANGEDITEAISPVYTTSSQLEIGAVLLIEADSADCWGRPTFLDEVEQEFAHGDEITIVDSLYAAELGIWWPVAAGGGDMCWIYDLPGLFSVVGP